MVRKRLGKEFKLPEEFEKTEMINMSEIKAKIMEILDELEDCCIGKEQKFLPFSIVKNKFHSLLMKI